MPQQKLRWVQVTVRAGAESPLRSLRTSGLEGMPDDLVTLDIPDPAQFPTAREKCRFLLNTAARIEHSLLVQYLYARFSLKNAGDLQDPTQQQAVTIWRRVLLGIAREEMSHLMTVQNLLLCTRNAVSFERQDAPLSDLDPFPLALEPLTQVSLAKYVVAEAPDSPKGIEDIIQQASQKVGEPVNRVGVLYAVLGVVFSSETGIDKNAAGGDPWFVMVRELAHQLYTGFPNHPRSAWHLTDDAFDAGSLPRQAEDERWGPGDAMRVIKVADSSQCLQALKDIGVQGEGLTPTGGGTSEEPHFMRFLKIYRGEGNIPAFPPVGGPWVPARDVPTNPKIVPVQAQAGPNDISAPDAVAWATLADQRYALLLGLLEQYFHEDPASREWIPAWAIAAMYQITALSNTLTSLNRSANGQGKAALPFTLPPESHLPESPEARKALLLARVNAGLTSCEALLAQDPANQLLTEIKQADETVRARLTGAIPPPGVSGAEQAFRQLLSARQSIARLVHGEITAGATTLGQLFKDKNYDAIIEFLRSGKSARAPYAGRKLVEPGKPEESALYLQLTTDEGVMSGRLTEAEVETVREWILTLQAGPVVSPPPPPQTDEMANLLKSKRARGRVMHGGIDVGQEQTLNDLFAGEKYAEILAFLKSGKAIVEPFAGKPLIVPGKPQESAFYLHISDPSGIMVGRFTPDEVKIVERWIQQLPAPADTVPPPVPKVKTTPKRIASGLSSPLFVTAPPGDPHENRLFIVEQTGKIKILDLTDGTVKQQAFLTVTNLSTGGERGLLGLAFHPKYAQNGLFYIDCTNALGHTEIRRYKVSANDTNVADANSMLLIARIEQPFANHNGGWLAFGPRDGYLYIGMGDGGSANDPRKNGQNRNVLLGKMLRIDVDNDAFPGDPTRNYAIPASNPFVGQVDVRAEIWAYGLRNPWRCSFDRATGDLYIGDVGQNAKEEIDFQPATSLGGENYGWSLKEGTLVRDPGATGLPLVDPIHEYGRSDGIAVIGGYVYRGSAAPSLHGTYFFADLTRRVWSFRYDNRQVKDLTDRTSDFVVDGKQIENISSFGEDANGELYVVSLDGAVYRMEATEVAMQPDEDRWANVAKVRIHPAIGVARMGNAGFANGVPTTPAPATDFFVGPERPFETSPPTGGYKRAGRVRRQAARFRLYAYDANDRLLGEITANDAEITWTVELANTKASWKRFQGDQPNAPLRNSQVQGANRQRLEIRPGPRTLTGINQFAAFDTGSFTDWSNMQPRTVSGIYLGGIQTEDSGRLLVLGGEGTAASPWNKQITGFANNNGWYDTTSDGPVNATVKLKGSNRTVPVLGAWVLCTPPKFAPALRNIITLHDTLRQTAIDRGLMPALGQPSFKLDIYPILRRAIELRWLMAGPGTIHDSVKGAFPPAGRPARNAVFRRLRNPNKGQGLNGPNMNMPMLFDDANDWQPQGDVGLAVTKTMYTTLTRWRDGDFVNDWDNNPPQPPSDITPSGLDQAALENCAGAAFFPGIEASWMLRDVFQFEEAFRLKQTGLSPGDVTKQMAIPWQADFLKCNADGGLIGWWPQQRPDEVFPENSTNQVRWTRDKVTTHLDMVNRWFELGFIVDNGTRFVETERNPNS